LPLANADVLVVEGTYVFQLADADVRIFLEATHEDTAERRRLRNRDVDAPIVDQVLAIEHALIAPQVRQADIVIDREFRIRSSRSRA
jgi:uridine kinase